LSEPTPVSGDWGLANIASRSNGKGAAVWAATALTARGGMWNDKDLIHVQVLVLRVIVPIIVKL